MTITAAVFDAYGTLFDVAAAAREAAAEPGGEALAKSWPALAAQWRSKQLQYTWLRAVTGDHTDFWTVTQDGLDWALEANGLDGDAALRERLLQLYWELSAFAEVPAMLTKLKKMGLQTAILSNGSPPMLDGAVKSAGLGDLLDDVLSVESVGIFKPAPQVYELVTKRFECDRSQVLFVSSNGWDAACAAAFGFVTAWVNRAGDPMDRLPGIPQHQLTDLTTIPDRGSQLWQASQPLTASRCTLPTKAPARPSCASPASPATGATSISWRRTCRTTGSSGSTIAGAAARNGPIQPPIPPRSRPATHSNSSIIWGWIAPPSSAHLAAV
jgi:2-haloacid dehalogenase